MITVSKDNTGDYTSIQEAVDAIAAQQYQRQFLLKMVLITSVLRLHTII